MNTLLLRVSLLTLLLSTASCTVYRVVHVPAADKAQAEAKTKDNSAVGAPAHGKPTSGPSARPSHPPTRSHMGPRISRSVGDEGGVLVLWPRVIPATDDAALHALAEQVQTKLVALAARAAPGKALDVRPAPERVCPQSGCRASSVGVLLVHQGEGCAAVALIAPPGRSAATMTPWAGEVTLKAQTVPFRGYPESLVKIGDFARCDALVPSLKAQDNTVLEALRSQL